jgi:hypothetical protein
VYYFIQKFKKDNNNVELSKINDVQLNKYNEFNFKSKNTRDSFCAYNINKFKANYIYIL